jgi:predicted lipid-binding transport protein (Tim44 family)
MGGVLNFVGAFINALFRLETSNRTDIRIWTSDDGGVGSMTTLETSGSMPVSMTPPEATVTEAPPSMIQRAHAEIVSLQTIDPDFSELQFLAQAGAGFETYLAAEGAMDPDTLAQAATPDFVDCFRKRVADWNGGGLQRIVSGVKMLGSAVFKVTLDGTRQAIVVRFNASAVRYSKDASTGIAVEGSIQPSSFTEFATFVRPAGSTTPKSAAAGAATHCPSCGAPTAAGAASCPFCGTQLTGTGAAWLLDKLSESAYT